MAEKEYVERDSLIEFLTVDFWEHYSGCHSSSEVSVFENMRDSIIEAPASDVVEVRHGEWQQYDQKYCSICGAAAPFTSLAFKQICSPYCHRCGAKMDRGK